MLNLNYFVTFETFERVSELRFHNYFRPKVYESRTLKYELKKQLGASLSLKFILSIWWLLFK